MILCFTSLLVRMLGLKVSTRRGRCRVAGSEEAMEPGAAGCRARLEAALEQGGAVEPLGLALLGPDDEHADEVLPARAAVLRVVVVPCILGELHVPAGGSSAVRSGRCGTGPASGALTQTEKEKHTGCSAPTVRRIPRRSRCRGCPRTRGRG